MWSLHQCRSNETSSTISASTREAAAPFSRPFDEATTANDVAIAIHAALVDVGLTPQAIRKIGCALISVSRSTERSSDASTARQPRGEKQ